LPSSEITTLAIGLVLAFGITAALSAAVTEAIARYRGLRGAFLLRGLVELLDGGQPITDLSTAEESYHTVQAFITRQLAAGSARAGTNAATPGLAVPSATSALLGGPILRKEGIAGQNLTLQPPSEPDRLPKLAAHEGSQLKRECRRLPTYTPEKSFVEAIVDLIVPDATEEITMATVRQHVDVLPDGMTALKPSLQALVKNAGSDIGAFRTSVERWFDHQMEHVSREYKRHVAKITFVAGVLIVLLANVNALTIGRSLYVGSTVNDAINTAMSDVAVKSTSCPDESQQDCLATLRAHLSAAVQTDLPIGWATVPDCTLPRARCNVMDQHGIFDPRGGSAGQAALFLLGLVLTIVALVPGARFWFGLLSRLGSALGFG